MSVEPPYSHNAGPTAVSPNVLRVVSSHIEQYHRMRGTAPKRSAYDDNFWIFGMANEDVPPIYKLPKPYAVYILQCEQPPTQEVQKRIKDNTDEFSDKFLSAYALSNSPVVYVGYTKNPYRRLDEHFDPNGRGAKFTRLFRPSRIQHIEWYETKGDAKTAEIATGNHLWETQGYFLNPSVHPKYIE